MMYRQQIKHCQCIVYPINIECKGMIAHEHAFLLLPHTSNLPELVLLDVCEGLMTVTEELSDEDPLDAT